MSEITLPLIASPACVAEYLTQPDLKVVDVSQFETYQHGHIQGAVWLNFALLLNGSPPAPGLLPPIENLQHALSAIGLKHHHKVVAYDNEGGGRATRFLWTLDVLGHPHSTFLDGGLSAWLDAGYETTTETIATDPSIYERDEFSRIDAAGHADIDYVLTHKSRPEVLIVDTRSPAEYAGTDVRANRGGHIPGAINLDWALTKDSQNFGKLKPDSELEGLLAERHITRDKTIIVHCQTHHRSSHTYWMLKHLGFNKIKGYAGSWSEWGNRSDTPIENSKER